MGVAMRAGSGRAEVRSTGTAAGAAPGQPAAFDEVSGWACGRACAAPYAEAATIGAAAGCGCGCWGCGRPVPRAARDPAAT